MIWKVSVKVLLQVTTVELRTSGDSIEATGRH